VRIVWNEPNKEQLERIPRLYATEDVPAKEKLIYLHFFIGASDWYIAEYDGDDIFFGYAILNGDVEMAEWGYVSFEELKALKVPPGFVVECDGSWQIRKAGQVEEIRSANGWPEPDIRKDSDT
jgi:hypothetical protein